MAVAPTAGLAARCWRPCAAVTAIWADVLLDRTPDWLPALRYVVLFGGLAAAAALAVADRLGATRRTLAEGLPSPWPRRQPLPVE